MSQNNITSLFRKVKRGLLSLDENRRRDLPYLAKGQAQDYRDAAEGGDAESQYQLGLCYLEGSGCREDDGEAERWLSLAAEQGHLRALYMLSECRYREGRGEEAVQLCHAAAQQGLDDARMGLRGICLDGDPALQALIRSLGYDFEDEEKQTPSEQVKHVFFGLMRDIITGDRHIRAIRFGWKSEEKRTPFEQFKYYGAGVLCALIVGYVCSAVAWEISGGSLSVTIPAGLVAAGLGFYFGRGVKIQ